MPPAPALELTFRGASDVVAYACPRCGQIVSPDAFGGDAEAHALAQSMAVEHCNRHCRCGLSIPSDRVQCSECWGKDQLGRDKKKFSVASRLVEDDYPDDPVYWEGHMGSMGLGYFENLSELRDYCGSEKLELPDYVWACNPVELHIDVDNILESVFQEHFEGARDLLPVGAEEELSTFLFGWCDRQNICSWQPDFCRAVVLNKDREPIKSVAS